MNPKKALLLAASGILVVVIAAIIFIPHLQRRHNESSAIKELCTIAIVQSQFQSSRMIDQNINDIGEYATLGELAGTSPRRGHLETSEFGPKDFRFIPVEHLNPTFIRHSFGPKISDSATETGYHFKVYLPGGVTDNGTGVAFRPTNSKIIAAQENRFRVYAWPVSKDSGTRCFAVDTNGKVVACSNVDANGELIYVNNKAPAFDAATEKAILDNIDDMPALIKPSAIAHDGQTWVLVEKAYEWIED